MTKSPPVSSLEDHLGYWMRSVSNSVSLSFARKVEGKGVTVAEWVLMRFLFDVELIPPTALADRMGITKGAVTKLADRLVEKGLVVRRANDLDKRAQTLALEPAGRDLVPVLASLADANDAECFECLDPQEKRELARILAKLNASIAPRILLS